MRQHLLEMINVMLGHLLVFTIIACLIAQYADIQQNCLFDCWVLWVDVGIREGGLPLATLRCTKELLQPVIIIIVVIMCCHLHGLYMYMAAPKNCSTHPRHHNHHQYCHNKCSHHCHPHVLSSKVKNSNENCSVVIIIISVVIITFVIIAIFIHMYVSVSSFKAKNSN